MKRGTQSRWHHDPPKKEGAEVSNIKGMLSKKQWNKPKKKRVREWVQQNGTNGADDAIKERDRPEYLRTDTWGDVSVLTEVRSSCHLMDHPHLVSSSCGPRVVKLFSSMPSQQNEHEHQSVPQDGSTQALETIFKYFIVPYPLYNLLMCVCVCVRPCVCVCV